MAVSAFRRTLKVEGPYSGGGNLKAAAWLNRGLLFVILVAAPAAFGPMAVAAAPLATAPPPVTSTHVSPFLALNGRERTSARKRSFHAAGSKALTFRGTSNAAGAHMGSQATRPGTLGSGSRATITSLTASTLPENLMSFAGTAQASTIHSFGLDQEVTPPNEDLAVGVAYLVEVVNSTVEVFSRSGAVLGAADLNTFMRVAPGYHSSDPRVIYDVSSHRFWLTISEVPNSGCPAAAPVLIAVSNSANPVPFTGWRVYALPIGTSGTLFGDQPGLGIATNTIAVTFNDFNCSLNFIGSEVDILQKSDLENNTGSNQDDFFVGGPFAPQPVREGTGLTGLNEAYVVTNESDCGVTVCANPVAEVDSFQGTPESGGVFFQQFFVAMTPTAVNDTTGFLPPADQPSPGLTLQTNDDRFLNAVEDAYGQIWASGGTSCQPSGDTVFRACMDYVDITVGNGTSAPTMANQLNNVGVSGADLFYPAVSTDSAGNMYTVFDESSTAMFPSVIDATVAQTGSTFSAFQLLHTSSTYYNGNQLFAGACDSEGCRWGDYSGAAQDPNADDVWVVSGSEDGSVEGLCTTAHACWNTRINQLTLTGDRLTAVTPASGPVVGGQTVTAQGFDFGPDTTFTFNGSPLTISHLTPNSFTFVTPPGPAAGGYVTMDAVDAAGEGLRGTAYSYIGLSNYVPVSPFRILDTRTTGSGGPLGPGAVRVLQVTGIGSMPVPRNATAVVLNVTEVNSTAASLLTLYSLGESRPVASNLNFAAHTVIANLVTISLVPYGEVNIYNALGSVNVVADVEGYFMTQPSSDFQGLFHPISPLRVCDTRSRSPTPSCTAHGALGSGTAMVVNVTGTGSGAIPGDGTAGAAVLNLTGVAGSAATYLSVFPTNSTGGCTYSGTHPPPVSTLNLPAGVVGANRVMVELGPASPGGPDTSVCVYNAVGTINVILDANGWFGGASATSTPPGYQYQALAPTRICDTRIGSASCTKGAIGAALSRLIGVDGHGLVPAVGTSTVAVAVIANLTAIAPTQGTYLTIYPSDPGTLQTRPLASDLNLSAGETLPNLVVVQLDTTTGAHDGYVSLFNSVGSVNAIVDIEGWFQ